MIKEITQLKPWKDLKIATGNLEAVIRFYIVRVS